MIKIHKEIIIFSIIFFGVSLSIYWLLNGGAYAKEIRYYLFLNSPFASQNLKGGKILEIKKDAITPKTYSYKPILYHGYELIIPKIAVRSPVIIPKKDDTKSILASLEGGVGLYPGSELPGHTGRGVILGHSSHASWYRGEYATIFALLPKLETGDTFFIFDKDKKYVYLISGKYIMTPEDTNRFLATPTTESEINLITCYPIGAASKRTIIQGKLITIESL